MRRGSSWDPGLIARYLATLTPEAAERVLLEPFGPVERGLHTSCLVMVATDPGLPLPDWFSRSLEALAGMHYEWLCQRFGMERVNAAIRQRVLRNLARQDMPRTPRPVPV